MMGTAELRSFVNGVSAKVNEVIDQTQDLTPSFLNTGLVQYVNNPNSLIYRTKGVTGLSYLEGKDEKGNYKKDEMYEAYGTEYVMKEKGKIVEISQLLAKTTSNELDSKINDVKQLMLATQRTMKKHFWQIIANGFSATDLSSQFPISRLDDGVSLYSTTHPSKVTGVGNRSNRAAGNPSLSTTSPFTLTNMLREMRNGRNLEIGYEGKVLFVLPSTLEQEAAEIFKSTLKADTANNDYNYYIGRIEFITTPYLSNSTTGIANADTSFYAFATEVDEQSKPLKFVSLIAPKIEHAYDYDSKAIKVSVDAAWGMGYSSFEYTAASDGSNT